MARESLTLYDYSDRELLLRIVDETDGNGDGWISSQELAEALQVTGDHPAQPVGIRLGWMRRYGAVERNDELKKWRLTRTGRALALGDLSDEQAAMLGELSAEQMLTLTRQLTTRYRRVGNTAAHLMRREMQLGIHNRKAG